MLRVFAGECVGGGCAGCRGADGGDLTGVDDTDGRAGTSARKE